MKILNLTILLVSFLLIKSDPDPNFYIFLCFGQSNMEGQGDIEEQDRTVPDRFLMMAPINFEVGEKRTQGQWYKATPPLCRDYARISPADYFGRQLVEVLPSNIRVGVINVSVGGCSIDLFDEDKAEEYLKTAPDWLQETAKKYNNNPFRVLMNRAKEAQRDGVIKGILLHQGEANNGDPKWPENVKRIYDRMLNELGLSEDKVPLLAGEVVTKQYNGQCWQHNEIIAKLPSVIKNAHVISAKDLPPKEDNIHFTTASYRTFGRRYGVTMLRLLFGEWLNKHLRPSRQFTPFITKN